jgi:hypothetical protein
MCAPDEKRTSSTRRPHVQDKAGTLPGTAMNEDRFRRSVVQTQNSCKEGATEGHSDVVLWGVRISCLSAHEQLCLLGSAMFFCHVLQGIITELVAKGVLSGLMWAAAAIELSVYSVLSCIELKMTNSSFDIRTMPWRSYISIAACISVGRGLTWVGYGKNQKQLDAANVSSFYIYVCVYIIYTYVDAVLAVCGSSVYYLRVLAGCASSFSLYRICIYI